MTTSENINPPIITEKNLDILITELEKYYNNFGSLNKNDFEALLFHVMMSGDNAKKSDYELSRLLRIPETKVKRLKYEADLKYSTKTEDDFKKEKIEQLNELLKNVSLKNEGKYLEFVVEDLSLRKFLDNILKKHNRFSDSSFNSEIVKIDINDLEILLCESKGDKELYDKLKKDAEELLKHPVRWDELVLALLKAAGNTTSIVDVSLPTLLGLYAKASNSLVNFFKRK